LATTSILFWVKCKFFKPRKQLKGRNYLFLLTDSGGFNP
jgi:hypothetical protein